MVSHFCKHVHLVLKPQEDRFVAKDKEVHKIIFRFKAMMKDKNIKIQIKSNSIILKQVGLYQIRAVVDCHLNGCARLCAKYGVECLIRCCLPKYMKYYSLL